MLLLFPSTLLLKRERRNLVVSYSLRERKEKVRRRGVNVARGNKYREFKLTKSSPLNFLTAFRFASIKPFLHRAHFSIRE